MAIKVGKRLGKSIQTGKVICYWVQRDQKSVSLEQIIKEISEKCTLNRADIEGIIQELATQITDEAKNGNRTKLHLLGTFKPCFKDVVTQKDIKKVSGKDIGYVSLRFHQSTWLRDRLDRSNLEFDVEKSN